jgi:glycosyltransferase involved in cell wall biosynthesis
MESKIVFITEFYSPVNTSTGYFITQIAEYVASKHKNVHVICSNAKYHKTDKVTFVKNEILNGVKIHRVLTGNINKNNFILRVIRLLISSIKLFIKVLMLVKKDDQILLVTNPAFLILFMPLIGFIKGVKYSILVHDIFPENLIAIGKIKNSSILAGFLKKWFNFSYAKAQKCIAIGRDMKEVIISKTGDATKVEFIPNWADTNDVTPLEKENTSLIRKLNLEGKFVFQFAGNLGHAQGLKNIIHAIKLVKNINIHFLFIGSGAMEEYINDVIAEQSLKNITLVGFQNKSEQNDFLNACDVSIVTLNKGMTGLGVPSKTYNIMATGKPILVVADKKSEISICISENNIGWVVEPGNPEILTSYFEKIYTGILNKTIQLNNPRIIAETMYSKEVILEKYNLLFINKNAS